jgi:dihydrodipicolinate synthase/N-acetylneuraminate lyase
MFRIEDTVIGVKAAIGGLPNAAAEEVQELFNDFLS